MNYKKIRQLTYFIFITYNGFGYDFVAEKFEGFFINGKKIAKTRRILMEIL